MSTHHAWMRHALIAAAAYNLLWGSWVVLSPAMIFRWNGLAAPAYPEIWQSVGLIAGAWGVGYAIASTDPVRHWPVVAAGLVGKILVPFGFAHAVSRGRFPLSFGWTILANDLVWWIPFGLILKAVWDQHGARLRGSPPEVFPFALQMKTNTGESIDRISQRNPTLLVFLRHAGCTFCREALSDLSRQRSEIEESGVGIVLVHMAREDHGRGFFSRYGLQDLPQISDPRQTLYRAFGLRRGTLFMLFGPKVWTRGFESAILNRNGLGRLSGDGFQMPGIFLVFHGRILRSYRHRSAADRPDYVRFVKQDMHEPVS